MFLEKLKKKNYKNAQEKHFLNVEISSLIAVYDISLEIDNDKLVKDISNFRKEHPKSMHIYNKEKTAVNAWHSDYFTNKITDILNPLIELKQEKIAKSFQYLKSDLYLCNIWINMYSTADYTKRHDHGFQGYGTVYYPYVETNPTPIVFDNNNTQLLKNFKRISITPKTGMLIVFPSYVPHMVHKVKELSRISISSNWLPSVINDTRVTNDL